MGRSRECRKKRLFAVTVGVAKNIYLGREICNMKNIYLTKLKTFSKRLIIIFSLVSFISLQLSFDVWQKIASSSVADEELPGCFFLLSVRHRRSLDANGNDQDTFFSCPYVLVVY